MRWVLLLVGLVAGLLVPASLVQAHGVVVEHRLEQAVVITAAYDTGVPMAGAQVAIYAPGERSTPWRTGLCDDAGRYQFVPDAALPGMWEIHVRQAGHGKTISVELGAAPASGASSMQLPAASARGGYTTAQLLVMSAAVVWGCVGTALFFARRSG